MFFLLQIQREGGEKKKKANYKPHRSVEEKKREMEAE